MCQFFSFLSDAKGNYYYADDTLRKKILKKDSSISNWFENADSHSSLAKHFLKNGAEDKLNAYEFNPLTKVFTKDKINIEDDSESAEKWVNELNWKRIVPELTIKKIVHPFKLPLIKKVTPAMMEALKNWDSVWDSIRDSVRDSVWGSVGGSVWDSIRDSVWDSVGDSVWDSIRDSVRDSVWGSVGGSVWDSIRGSVWGSVRDSVGGYISSFFAIKYKYDFSSINKLWDKGIVPSFDGKLWRLHSGEKAKIVLEITKEDLQKYSKNRN